MNSAAARGLVVAAVQQHLAEQPLDLPPGAYEVRVGIDGAADGWRVESGAHGQLTIGRQQRTLDDLIVAALAVLLEALGAQAGPIAADLAKTVKAGAASPAATRQAKAAWRRLRKLTGVDWRATPSYKPRS